MAQLPLAHFTPNGDPGKTFGYGSSDRNLTATRGEIPIFGYGKGFALGDMIGGSIGSTQIITGVQSGSAGDSGGPALVWQTENGAKKEYFAGPVLGGIAEGTQPYFYTDVTHPVIQKSIEDTLAYFKKFGLPTEKLVLRFPKFTTQTILEPIKVLPTVGQGGISISVQGSVQEIMPGYTLLGRRALVDVTYTNPDQCIVGVTFAAPDGIKTDILNASVEGSTLHQIVQTIFQDIADFNLGKLTFKLNHNDGNCAESPEHTTTIKSSVVVTTNAGYDMQNSHGLGGKPFTTGIMTTTYELSMENKKWVVVDPNRLENEGVKITLYKTATGAVTGQRNGKNIIFTGTGTMKDAIITFDNKTAITLIDGKAEVPYFSNENTLVYLPIVNTTTAASQ